MPCYNQQYNFNITQNSNFYNSLNLQNSDGSYVNLSGFAITGAVKYQYSSSGILFYPYLTIDPSYISGLIYVSGVVGTGIPAGQYPYQFALTQIGYEQIVLNGYYSISPTVLF